ncbi:ATP-grasp domain-containing protein [Streptomyces sp. ICBB 8177]|uniref:ATP-grasp domain-containing protein n=1 Tax=Streptomyces sp. ICBB 8177 TaxID=563922 RepID=UPI000D672589|nr:ATP-grasp domain-containing protein [Streptomyces sp. ICBB 8177]PWI43903.1 siderophore biosynthesis protein [Streptomyces sp. ICBB 8177]
MSRLPALAVLALNPTDSVTHGFLPAATRLGLDVTVLTEARHVSAHRDAYAARDGSDAARVAVVPCEVTDFREVVATLARLPVPDAVFSNSDHLQTQAALAAEWFGLPGKDWRTALRVKNKAHMRRHLASRGIDTVRSAEVAAGGDPADLLAPDLTYPCVLKPREGVASEDVVLVANAEELWKRAAEARARRPGAALVAEEFLPGDLRTLETLGDADGTRHVLGGFRTRLSPPPYFIEEGLTWEPDPDRAVTGQVLAQLDALGVAFGICHTEFVVDGNGRARLVEVNYRAIGDQCDLLLADLLEVPLFEHVLRVHLGEPLPRDLGARTDGRARQDTPCADRAGTLTTAPRACERTVDGCALTYRPLRAIGERHELYHTNRDYLGVLRVVGDRQRTVDRVAEEFLAGQRWEITP